MAFNAKEKLDCARRELALRRRVYPRFIESGKMTDHQATREIALMGAIVEDYERIVADARGQQQLGFHESDGEP